jgi:hypothetical protein
MTTPGLGVGVGLTVWALDTSHATETKMLSSGKNRDRIAVEFAFMFKVFCSPHIEACAKALSEQRELRLTT